MVCIVYSRFAPQWGLRIQKLRTRLLRTQNSKVSPFKPGVGQNIALHASPTTRDFFLEQFLPSQSIHLHYFSKPLPRFPVLAVVRAAVCVGVQNEIGQPARCHRRLMQVPVVETFGFTSTETTKAY